MIKRIVRWAQRKLFPGLTPQRRGSYRAYLCVGGPFAGQHLNLHTPGTLTFTIRGQTGPYVRSEARPNEIHWEPVDTAAPPWNRCVLGDEGYPNQLKGTK